MEFYEIAGRVTFFLSFYGSYVPNLCSITGLSTSEQVVFGRFLAKWVSLSPNQRKSMKTTIVIFIAVFSLFIAGTVHAQDASLPEQETCVASFYHDYFHGRQTASGVPFYNDRMYAAHKTLPFGTILRVTNLANGRSALVKVVDRGPYVEDRGLDLSYTAAKELGYVKKGVANVVYEIVPKNSPAAYKWRKDEKRREIRFQAEQAREASEAMARDEAALEEENNRSKGLIGMISHFKSPLILQAAWAGKTMYALFVNRFKGDGENSFVVSSATQAD